MDLGNVDMRKKVSFSLNNQEICDKITDKLAKFSLRNGLKYHKIKYKSRRNNPIKLFQLCIT